MAEKTKHENEKPLNGLHKIYDEDGTEKESPSFNFSRNSSKYIRSVLNTNPQLVNETMISSGDRKTYWLGETFNREIEGVISSTATGACYGVLLPLASSSFNWADRKESASEAMSGWVFSQKETNQVNLFRLKCMHVGDDFQKNHMIAIENIKEPSNRNVDAYGTFTVAILDMNGMAVERYNNLNLNPASTNYIGKRIGDQYQSWDSRNRRYRTYGDYKNNSDHVYVEINQNIADGGGGGLLPAGFKGPVRPKGFSLSYGSKGVQTYGDVDNTGTFSARTITIGGTPATGSFIGLTSSAGRIYRIGFDSGKTLAQSILTFTGSAGSYGGMVGVSNIGGAGGIGQVVEKVHTLLTGITDSQDVITNPFRSVIRTSGSILDISSSVAGTQAVYPTAHDGSSEVTFGSIVAGTDTDDNINAWVKGNDDTLITGGDTTIFAAGPFNYSASFNFPAIPLRGAGTDGGASDPYRCYWGIRPKLSTTSTTNDPDYCDYLRGLPADVDNNWVVSTTYYEHSINFSLDDIVIKTSSNTLLYVSGAYSRTDDTDSDPSYTKGTGSFGDLLDLNVRQFLMPMWGGTEGFDITEKEPLRNDLINPSGGGWSETTNYIQYTLNKAIDSIKDAEVVPGNLLLAPGIYAPLITNKLISTAESRKDLLAIIDIENDYKPTQESTATATSRLGSVTSAVSSLKNRNLNSSYACCFYPWVQISDSLGGGQYVWIPSSVAGLGAMAKSQAKSDVWFAPAGFNRGGLGNLGGRQGPPVIQARQRLDSSERDKLYEVNINPIATFPAEGVVIFGQKTLQAGQSALDRINVRRLLLHLKSKVSTVSRNLLFDQNIDSTWARFKSQVNPILANVQARFGLTDYKLILDETTTTADLIDRNIMYAKIFIKPARAIEYIVVDFVITKTGAEFV